MNIPTHKLDPLIITVAPNGARKTKKDHIGLPISPDELAKDAYACIKAGASMIHLHVRADDETHILDVARYREATSAIQNLCGEDIIIQATTEAVGQYSAPEQMKLVRELRPQSASLAIGELVPEGGEAAAKEFFQELVLQNILPHYIVYSAGELRRFLTLVNDGIIPEDNIFLLFVLGRYSQGQTSHPSDLLPFLAVLEDRFPWSVCAFGPLEHASASAAVALGGHVRVGFENNIFLKNGEIADGNANLVSQVTSVASAVGRPTAAASEIYSILQK
ncbi:MAG: 3-keto-5-aminohexanoate cleavage protein [Sneathiella sp.]|nr:3-keto-5-aminohexanoate cleavage protein [Sneathiella sp.]